METRITSSGPIRRETYVSTKDEMLRNLPSGNTSCAKGKDTQSWSKDALEWLEQQQQIQLEIQARQEQRRMERGNDGLSELSQANKMLDTAAEGLRRQNLCAEIAARIRRGDKVPLKDKAFLMKSDPELYRLAMLMRKPKKHPEKCKSVLKDEDEKQINEEGTSSADTGAAAAGSADATAFAGAGTGSGSASGGNESGGGE